MTVNQSPVEPVEGTSGQYDPSVDRVAPEDELRGRALEHLKKKADFRVHLLIYLLVNGLLVLIWAMTGAHFFWPAFVMAGWGVGLVANAYDVYVRQEPTEDEITAEMDRLRHL